MTSVEKRLMTGTPVTFHEALYDCCLHGELTEEQAREWLAGEDLELALRVINSGLFLTRSSKYLEWKQNLQEK